MEFIEALNDLIKVSGKLNEQREKFEGYDFGYHFHYDIKRVEEAEKRFNEALESKIMKTIKKINKDEN